MSYDFCVQVLHQSEKCCDTAGSISHINVKAGVKSLVESDAFFFHPHPLPYSTTSFDFKHSLGMWSLQFVYTAVFKQF